MDQEEKEELIKDIKKFYPYLTNQEIINTYIIANEFEHLFKPVTVRYMLPYIFNLANNHNVKKITLNHMKDWANKKYFYRGIEKTIEDAIFKIAQEKIIKNVNKQAISILQQEIKEFNHAIKNQELLYDIEKILQIKLTNWLNNCLVPEIIGAAVRVIDNKVAIPEMWLKLNNTSLYQIIKRENGSFLLNKI